MERGQAPGQRRALVVGRGPTGQVEKTCPYIGAWLLRERLPASSNQALGRKTHKEAAKWR